MLLFEANIPQFLHSSPYLQSLLSNGPFPEEGLEIPNESGKQDLTVRSKADLIELLSTLRFWLVPEVAEQSLDLLTFVFSPVSQIEFVEVATEFRNDIPLVDELFQIILCNENEKVETAARFGRLHVLRYLCEEVGLESKSLTASVAAAEGHLDCLTYLHSKGLKLTENEVCAASRAGQWKCAKYIIDSSPAMRSEFMLLACKEAAEHGHLSCVEHMLAEWGKTYSTVAMSGAASGNHLEILNLAIEVEHDERSVQNAMLICAAKGHLECLKRLHSLNYEKHFDLMNSATVAGHLNCLQFLHQHNYPGTENVCSFATNYNYLECLQYAHEQGMPWDEYTCLIAAAGGSLDCLKYAREQGCPWWDGPAVADLPVNSRNTHCTNRTKVAVDMETDDDNQELISVSACRAPTIDCLLYVLEQGAALSSRCPFHAAGSGSLATLQFLHARGFTWEVDDCEFAAWADSLECFRFLHEIGTPWDASTLAAAAYKGNMLILQYGYEHGAPWEAAASLGCEIDAMKFVHEHGCPWHADTCLTAAQSKNLECLQYAHEHGAPWTSEVCRLATTVECYEYAVAHGCPGAELNTQFFNQAK